MSDRTAVGLDDKTTQLLRDYGDRISALEKRTVQGSVAMDTLTVSDLRVGASRTTPMQLNGSEAWTQDVEYLGTLPPGVDNGGHAVVTRDHLGRIQGINPAPIMMVESGPGAGLAVAIATPTVVTAIGATPTGATLAESAMYNGLGVFNVPIYGYWTFSVWGVWVGVADTTLRQLFLDISGNGGVSFSTIVTDYRVQQVAGDNVYHALTYTFLLAAGTQIRTEVRTRSAAGGTYFNGNMTLKWERGPA